MIRVYVINIKIYILKIKYKKYINIKIIMAPKGNLLHLIA